MTWSTVLAAQFIVLYARSRMAVSKDTFIMNTRILISYLQTIGMAASLSIHLPEGLLKCEWVAASALAARAKYPNPLAWACALSVGTYPLWRA